jgi:hypothetical protein
LPGHRGKGGTPDIEESIDSELLDSERECLEHCKTFEQCEWYMFDSSIGYCDVLEDCSEVSLLLLLLLWGKGC